VRETLLTGFPGFLASRLLPLLLEDQDRSVTALAAPFMHSLARRRLEELEERAPWLQGRVRILAADLSDPQLLDGPVGSLEPADVFHLAAIYRLDVDRSSAMAVNVEGTRRLAELARESGSVWRFHHVSTCYVSGRYAGTFHEKHLEEGQTFNNHYEESKYLAELAVRNTLTGMVPFTIYRPSIVVGDSRTGQTGKYDGPYRLFQWIRAQPGIAVVPRVPGMRDARLNVVPVDFVVRAIAALSRRRDTRGRTLHLADPDPLPVRDFLRVSGRSLGKAVLPIPTPPGAARMFMSWAGRLPGFPRIPGESLAYLSHPTHYGMAATLPLLEEVGILPPPFRDYAERIVSYMENHPDPMPARGSAVT
jgi:thioester reductase-like protein